MGTTAVLKLPYPELTDTADIPRDVKALADKVDLMLAGAGTSLPGTPTDGQEVNYLADATNGIVWRFRYRAASASAYKWEFVGGSNLYSEVVATELCGGSYADLTTVGPSITVPLAGDYFVQISTVFVSASSSAYGAMSYAIGATAAVDADAADGSSQVANQQMRTIRERRKNALAAGTALVAKYRGSVACSFLQRNMRVTPIRVG